MAKRIILGVFALLFLNNNLFAQTSSKISSNIISYLEGFLGKIIVDLPKEALHLYTDLPKEALRFYNGRHLVDCYIEKINSNLGELIYFDYVRDENNENKITQITYYAKSKKLSIIENIRKDIFNYMSNKYSEYIYVNYLDDGFDNRHIWHKNDDRGNISIIIEPITINSEIDGEHLLIVSIIAL